MDTGITIRQFESGDQSYFEAFNRQWIEEYFEIEPVDEQVLKRPDQHILAAGDHAGDEPLGQQRQCCGGNGGPKICETKCF